MFVTQLLFDYIFANVIYFTIFLVLISVVVHIVSNLRLRLHLPAGPVGLPLVGHLPFLGKEPHKTIAKLGDKYGSVFTLQLGVYNVVILNDWEAVKEALNKDSFLGKPTSSPFTVVNSDNDNAISFADDSGYTWSADRRFALQVLRDLGFGKGSMEDRITDEISYLIKHIDGSNGEPVNIHKLLTPSISNIIMQLVFGHRYDYDEPKRQALDQLVDQLSQVFSMTGFLATAPVWLSRLVFKMGLFGDKKQFDYSYQLFDKEISSHQKLLDVNNRRDYIDGYLMEMDVRQRKDPNSNFNMKRLQSNLRMFFGAGSETIRSTTEWLFLLSVRYSEHQKRIHEEIDSVVGRDRSPCYADRLHMPFTQAFINEVMRYKTLICLNLARCTVEDTSVLGHFIPKDTKVLANIWAVHNDPKVWHKPQDFNPNRFLTNDGKQVIKTEALIPFSTGKRNCVGETLGRVEVFLYFVSLLQRYTISVANDGTVVSLEERFGLTLQPKDAVVLRFHKRV